MNYTASSVYQSLSALEKLVIHGELQCPQNDDWISTNNTLCANVPQKCAYAKEQRCKQKIVIFDQEMKLCELTFYFTISQTNDDGFIDENDLQLRRLLRNQKNQGCPINVELFVKC